MSEEMKRFLQEELKKEANEIMREVDADQDVESLTAPSKIDEKLYEQIRQYKEEQESIRRKIVDRTAGVNSSWKNLQKKTKETEICGSGGSSYGSICGGDYKCWRTGEDISEVQ